MEQMENRRAGGDYGKEILAGIDVGSTTTKIVAWDDAQKRIIFSSYERHHADQLQSIIDRLNEFYDRFLDAACGSASPAPEPVRRRSFSAFLLSRR